MALILVMGIPAAGKTTFCQRMKESAPELVATTSFDAFRNQEDKCTQINEARETRKLFEKHCKLTIPTKPIHFIEDIFYLQSMRRPFEKLARQLHFDFYTIFLSVELDIAIVRNSHRSGNCQQSEETIRKVFDNLEISDECIILDTEQATSITLTKLFENILGCSLPKNISKPVVNVRQIKKPNILKNNIDVITRRILSEIIKDSAQNEFDVKKLNDARKRVFHKIKEFDNWCIGDVKKSILDEYYNKCL